MSYPACCADATFMQTFRPRPYSEIFKLGQANRIDFRLNNFYLRSGVRANLINHYVCDYKCPETVQYVDNVIAWLKANKPALYDHIKNALSLPILMVAPGETNDRIVGGGVMFTFRGAYSDEHTLNYEAVLYHDTSTGNQYQNPETGNEIFKKLVMGNSLKISPSGITIYDDGQEVAQVNNDLLVFLDFIHRP